MTIGDRIKLLLKKHHLTQKELAEILGMPFNTLSSIIRGIREPGIKKVILIAKYFNVSLDWLLTGEEYQKVDKSIKFHLHHLKGGVINNVVNTGLIIDEPINEFNINLPQDITDNEINYLLQNYIKLSRKSRQMILKMIELYLEEEKESE